jgi:1-deoxy-D-xylulose-5-phosphate reductoisomerase
MRQPDVHMEPATLENDRGQGAVGLTILGATGTIGVNTLDVVRRHPHRFRVHALTGHRNIARLAEQCRTYRPRYAVVLGAAEAERLQTELREAGLAGTTMVLCGESALCEVCEHPETDFVMAGIVGAAGLAPTLAAAKAGKRVLLANKEALVMSGQIFMDEVRRSGAELLPIDSEHNAVFQCLPPAHDRARKLASVGVSRILLTASGGPFLDVEQDELEGVTPSQACAHPNWVMGRKISVDSATMMNKGLEVIEACWLFGVTPDQVEVVIHPQSVIHSLVSFVDGSVLAQLGNPDMRTPIAHALAWPDRISSGVADLDLASVARLEFARPDTGRFPCLRLAYEALDAGGTASAALNAANEVAVQAFLDQRIAFPDIARVIETTLEGTGARAADSLAAVLQADAEARVVAQAAVDRCAQARRLSL